MVEINNLTTVSIAEEFLKKVAKIVLKRESASWRKEKANLSIALVGQGKIKELNKKYRGENRVTDVLSFPESKALLEKFKVGSLQRIQGLGEIVICPREVKKSARVYIC